MRKPPPPASDDTPLIEEFDPTPPEVQVHTSPVRKVVPVVPIVKVVKVVKPKKAPSRKIRQQLEKKPLPKPALYGRKYLGHLKLRVIQETTQSLDAMDIVYKAQVLVESYRRRHPNSCPPLIPRESLISPDMDQPQTVLLDRLCQVFGGTLSVSYTARTLTESISKTLTSIQSMCKSVEDLPSDADDEMPSQIKSLRNMIARFYLQW